VSNEEFDFVMSKDSARAGLNSGMDNLAVLILVGLVAGFLASRVVRGKGAGLLFDIILGILGAIVGGWLANLVGFSMPYGIFGQIVIAFLGAVLLLIIWRALFGKHR
jgi:uncharacterized membrane protein YeaQ/YmgE (transglycosylase-associated protein family)